ncbi:MAG TPA: VOC family protein [Gaiellaceae bacterium]|nr:VOC family protein [Gaiellaceae bacterium]
MAVSPIPEGYHNLQIYLAVEDASKAIDFYKEAFGAEETIRMPGPDGSVAHAELQVGDSKLMLSDPFPHSSVRPPSERGGCTASVFMYVDDADAVFDRAQAAGATVTSPLENMFWGDRFGSLTDPFGHVWSVATHIEDVPEDEMAERAASAMAEMGAS